MIGPRLLAVTTIGMYTRGVADHSQSSGERGTWSWPDLMPSREADAEGRLWKYSRVSRTAIFNCWWMAGVGLGQLHHLRE